MGAATGTASRPVRLGEPPRQFRRLPRAGVLLESARIYNFQGIRWRRWRFRSTTKMPKCFVFWGLASLGIRFFEPVKFWFESGGIVLRVSHLLGSVMAIYAGVTKE